MIVAVTHLTADEIHFGPLIHEFGLTLAPGHRVESVGPLLSYELKGLQEQTVLAPLFSYTHDHDLDLEELDLAYPLFTYDRFGSEFRIQLFQLLSFAGGSNQEEEKTKRLTLFPLYFQQRSSNPELDYTAVFPLYGKLQNRVFRDRTEFVLWPAYVKTHRRGRASSAEDDPFLGPVYRNIRARRGEVTTYNYLFPFFHLRYGEGLKGWQFWPLMGNEEKVASIRTNDWDDIEIVAGHDKSFLLWPLFLDQKRGIGTENPEHEKAFLPFYTRLRSPQRDSTTYLWPLGLTITDDRARKYREVGAPWPLIVFTRGEGKTVNRIWPLFSQAGNSTLQSDFYLWPLYKSNRAHSPPLDRKRTRILFFLYSDLIEKNEETSTAFQRTDLWPLFSARREHNGDERLQLLALLEPFFPSNKSIERNYSPVWSIWRSAKNARTGAASVSFLWNLYRLDTAPGSRKCSLLFGLFQYQSDPEGSRVRLFHIPVGKSRKPSPPKRES